MKVRSAKRQEVATISGRVGEGSGGRHRTQSSLRMALPTCAYVSCLTTDGGSSLSGKGNEIGNLLTLKGQPPVLKKLFIYQYFCC